MLITNKIYKNHNLANAGDRGENFIVDFLYSSIIPLCFIYFLHSNILISILVYFLFRFVYYFGFKYFFGRTLGKFQTKTITVNVNSEKPSVMQLIKRNTVRFISLISAVGDKERAIHDKISNTFVVKNEKLKRIDFFNYFRIIIIPIYLYFLYHYLIRSAEFNKFQVSSILVLLFIFLVIPKSVFKKCFKNN